MLVLLPGSAPRGVSWYIGRLDRIAGFGGLNLWIGTGLLCEVQQRGCIRCCTIRSWAGCGLEVVGRWWRCRF